MLCFIREEGFTEKKEKRADLPEGIHRRGDKFIARCVKTQGDHHKKQQFGYKTFDSLDDANSFKLQADVNADDHDAAGDDARQEGCEESEGGEPVSCDASPPADEEPDQD